MHAIHPNHRRPQCFSAPQLSKKTQQLISAVLDLTGTDLNDAMKTSQIYSATLLKRANSAIGRKVSVSVFAHECKCLMHVAHGCSGGRATRRRRPPAPLYKKSDVFIVSWRGGANGMRTDGI